ncbi:MAG: hypothetical protein ACM65L_14580 [Microcoleus sp.]
MVIVEGQKSYDVTTKRFSIAEYHRLGELGFFAPDERVELIRGEIIKMASKGRLQSGWLYLTIQDVRSSAIKLRNRR